MTPDERFMALALRVARRGLGRTHPNPPVGAVIVRDGVVCATGYHRRAGAPHAEIDALQKLGFAAPGATLYCTLEPCNHAGRTPPCTPAILRAGLRRVVYGCADPNPHVAGQGGAYLAHAGLEVTAGVLGERCRELIAGWTTFVTCGRPFVTLKLAATLDGKIAGPAGDAAWISGPASRALVHRLRREVDAVLVGAGTALADDPQLTARTRAGRPAARQPVRVVFDSRPRLSPAARLFRAPGGGPVWIVTAGLDAAAAQALEAAGATLLRVPLHGAHLDVRAALRALAERDLTTLLVEGGSRLGAALLTAHVVDRLLLFVAPTLIGGSEAVPLVGDLAVSRLADAMPFDFRRCSRSGADLLIEAVPRAHEPAPAPLGSHDPCSPASSRP